MAKRKKVPKAIQDDLLTQSGRRCCLCFGLNNDFEVKKGQVAHLDDDPSNNDPDNLAWLCLDHHDEYDSRTSVSKGLQIGEVKRYREELYQAVDERRGSGGPKEATQVAGAYHAAELVDGERRPRVFLCHATEDKPRVQELYHRLKEAGYHPWPDKEDLLPGQPWRPEIEGIIRNLDNIVVVCLSTKSITKKGVVQKEIKWALDVLDQMPEDTIYLIPARLEACQVPDRLSSLQWVNLFEPDGFEKLKQALDFELGTRPATPKPELTLTPTQPYEPELILIPASEFLMGSAPGKDNDTEDVERPQHSLYLPDYYMAKAPVTNAQYAAFVKATNHRQPKHWKGGKPPARKQDHPVVRVTWHEAAAYCKWLAQATGKAYRLPSEVEWEKGARGTAGRIYPWGDDWDAKRCNTKESGPYDTTPVGTYPQGASPYGLLDMAGNVWEWCATRWRKGYPYDVSEDELSAGYLEGNYVLRVLRGGSWYDLQGSARCTVRRWYYASGRFNIIGFRLCAASQQE